MKSPNDTRKQHHHSLKIPPQACVQIMRAESFSSVMSVFVIIPCCCFFVPPPPSVSCKKTNSIKSQYIIKPALFVLRLSPLLYLLFNSEHFYIKKKSQTI